MPFRLSEEQWATIKRRIDRLGGYEALDHVRVTIEDHIATAFIKPDANAQISSAFFEAHKAAEQFRDAIEYLAKLQTNEASHISDNDCFSAEISNLDARSRTKFGKFMREYAEDLRQEVAWRTGDAGGKRRGRPIDKAMTLLCARILETARHEQWITTDHRNRTSSALIDLMTDLMKCAKAAGLTKLERDRRAFINAMGDARKEQERALQASAWLHKELDALGQPAPENAGSDANCLCSVPPNSD